MQQQVKLYGEAGTLEIDYQYGGPDAGTVVLAAHSEDQEFQRLEVPAEYWVDVRQSDPWEVFTKQSAGCRAFIDAILENQILSPSFHDGYKAQQVIEGAMISHRLAKWITIEDPIEQAV